MAAQFKLMKGDSCGAHPMNGARDQFFSRAGFARISTVASVGATTSTCPSPASWPCCCLPISSNVRDLDDFFVNALLRSRSRRSCTKVIHRNGESFNTAVAIRTGIRVPSLRTSSFSKGVQAPNRNPSRGPARRAPGIRRRQIGPA